jgi:TetR/AcrR family transcriptional regulator
MVAENTDRAQEILEAATVLFARHGYAGVSVRDICSRVDANSSASSYYFGSKQGLYRRILRARFEACEEALDTIISRRLNPREELLALCDRLDAIHSLYPHLSAITCRESVNPSPEFIAALSAHEAKYQGGYLLGLIRAGQKAGLFRPGLNPVYLSRILSLLFNSQVIARSTCGFLHPETRFSDAEYFATVKAILTGGLLTPSAGESGVTPPA